jgi:sugar phosphate permease
MVEPMPIPISETSDSRRGKKALFIFSLLCLGYFLVYFHRLSPAVMALDLMKTFQTGGAMLGLLGSAYFYPYAIMQLPAGLLADSWGPRKSITLFLGIGAVGSLLFGLAPNFGTALFARVLVGLGVSMVFIPAMKILALWFQPRQFVHMAGLLMTMGGLGSLSAAAPLAWFSRILGWRLSFILISGLTILLAYLIWHMVRDHPEELGFSPVYQREYLKGEKQTTGLWAGIRQVLTNGYFWPLAICYFFIGGIFFSFIGLWGGPFLMQVYGFGRDQAAYILSMSALAIIFGSPAFSLLSDRLVKSRKRVLIGSSLMMVLTTFPLTFSGGSLSLFQLYLICTGMGLFSAAVVSVLMTATKELFPDAIAGTSTGLVNLFPFLGGAIFQPLIGMLLESGDRVAGSFTAKAYQSAFSLFLYSALLALLAILFMKETFPQRLPLKEECIP